MTYCDTPTLTLRQLECQRLCHIRKVRKLIRMDDGECKSKPVIVNGHRYASSAQAAQATGFTDRSIREAARSQDHWHVNRRGVREFTARYV